MAKTRINNNILAVLILVYIVATIFIDINMYNMISGRAVGRGKIMLCYGGVPVIEAITPSVGIVSGIINVTARAFTSVPGEPISKLTFSFHTLGGPQIIGTDTYDGDEYYNISWDTTQIPDVNCNILILANASASCATNIAEGGIFSINNHDVEPIWDEFKNNYTTNLSNYTSWFDLHNITIGNENGTISFTGPYKVDLDEEVLNSDIEIQFQTMQVYHLSWDCEPTAAYIKMKHKFIFPKVLLNGNDCSTCTVINITNETIEFWANPLEGNYTLVEDANLSVDLHIRNITPENSFVFNATTYWLGQGNLTIAAKANCSYKTDYNPTSFTLMEITNNDFHQQRVPMHYYEYIPLSVPALYHIIQHHEYLDGNHTITVNCTNGNKSVEKSANFTIVAPKRDKVFYKNNDKLVLFANLDEIGLNVSADYSSVDSDFNQSNLVEASNNNNYTLTYQISPYNSRGDGQYNVTAWAYNTSIVVMNQSLLINLKQSNNWTWNDTDFAVSCYTKNPGWYFDEIACSWKSDVNFAIKEQAGALVEDECDDTIDNDGDGMTDCQDTDCAGVMYMCRNNASIDSAVILDDPCTNNLCYLSLGPTKVYYIQNVRPGAEFRAKFEQSNLHDKLVQVAINNLSANFGLSDNTTTKRQLALKLVTKTSITSKSYTPDSNASNDYFTGDLKELLTFTTPSLSGVYNVEFVRSVDDNAGTMRATAYFNMNTSSPLTEADYINSSGQAEFCIDGLDNDLNSPLIDINGTELNYSDCKDPNCNGSIVFYTARCNYPNEFDCNDSFDNDLNNYMDCQDNMCFKKIPYCPINEVVCYNNINDDADYGLYGNASISVSYQDSLPDYISLVDCLDVDCNNSIGRLNDSAICEYAIEKTCNDSFDNDADGPYDCNASGDYYERDCDRWHALSYTCPYNETICYDNNDNDLDSDYPYAPQYGGIDCGDLDCNNSIGRLNDSAICEYAIEKTCNDSFDNNRNGAVDCWDSSCNGINNICRPCPNQENITIDSCANGIDDDYDGLIDCEDLDCYDKIGPNGYHCGLTETNCSDGIDNNHDWYIDCDDIKCNCTSTEFDAGNCLDEKDNDNDNETDCDDPDCRYTAHCYAHTKTYPSSKQISIGNTLLTYSDYVHTLENASFIFSQKGLTGQSVLLLIGDINHQISQINSYISQENTSITGTTTNFIKLVNNNSLQAENTIGFTGDLNLTLHAQTSNIGEHGLLATKSIDGTAGYAGFSLYISENEKPRLVSISPPNNSVVNRNFQMIINATDNTTFNSGIRGCRLNISNMIYDSDKCRFNMTLDHGEKTIILRIYDGAMNYEDYIVNYNITPAPVQEGPFYEFTNYPLRDHFRYVEHLGIGVNFNSSNGFINNTYCLVRFYDENDTQIASAQINLTALSSTIASCTGEVSINITPGNGFYKFDVVVNDSNGFSSASTLEKLFVCEYKNNTINNKTIYMCLDYCELKTAHNHAPLLINNIPDIKMQQDSTYSGLDLDDYFFDPDRDYMTYNSTITAKINITINEYGIITIKPDFGWYGTRIVYFYANDGFGGWNVSNPVKITVTKKEIPPQPPSGGGGGGGEGGVIQQPLGCIPSWNCSNYSECLPSGIQTRVCVDTLGCSDPVESSRPCVYIPTCFDNIKNGNETGIDCGGPCEPCPTCHDGIKNQGEERTDCGGPCEPCPTCHDGIKNQGEIGIDFGGPCPMLSILEKPMRIRAWGVLGVLLLLILLGWILYKYGDKIIHSLHKLSVSKKREIDECEYLYRNVVALESELEKISSADAFARFESIYKKYLFHLTRNLSVTPHEVLEHLRNDLPRKVRESIVRLTEEYYLIKYSGEEINKKKIEKLIKIIKQNLNKTKIIHKKNLAEENTKK